jgi:hypothetical protein
LPAGTAQEDDELLRDGERHVTADVFLDQGEG